MARIPLIDEHDATVARECGVLIEKISGARRGALINVYRLLLHAPPLAEAWLNLINAVRWHTKLSGRLREIAIIRIGYLTDTPYIVKQHVPRLAVPEGLTLEDCAALADWRASTAFNDAERAVLAYTDAMTRDIKVPDAVFAALRPHLDDRQITELSVLVGAYNMHARVMTALAIDPEPDH